jgi:hypothetical protein
LSAFPARRASGFRIHRGTGVAFARVANTRILVTCALALALVPRAGRALPDLSPEIYDVTIETGVTVASGDVAEGCAATTDNRILIRFGVRSHNLGADALVMGDPGCPTAPPIRTRCTRMSCSSAARRKVADLT